MGDAESGDSEYQRSYSTRSSRDAQKEPARQAGGPQQQYMVPFPIQQTFQDHINHEESAGYYPTAVPRWGVTAQLDHPELLPDRYSTDATGTDLYSGPSHILGYQAQQGEPFLGYPTYQHASPEGTLLRTSSSSAHTADLLHSWQNQQHRLLVENHDVPGHSAHAALPSLSASDNPEIGDLPNEGSGHTAGGWQPAAYPEAPALGPGIAGSHPLDGSAGGLSISTEGLAILGTGSDSSSRPSPNPPAPAGDLPSWLRASNPQTEYGGSGTTSSGITGFEEPPSPHLSLGSAQIQLSPLPHELGLSAGPRPFDTSTPDVLQTAIYYNPFHGNAPPHSPFLQSPILGPPPMGYNAPVSHGWSSYQDGTALESPPIAGIERMEAPSGYFQQMPVQSQPPYSVPLPGPSTPRPFPHFTTPAVPTMKLPPMPRNMAYASCPGGNSSQTSSPAIGTSTAAAKAPTKKSGATKSAAGKRENRQAEGNCDQCGNFFAMLYLRGYEADYKDPFYFTYTCIECSPSHVDQKSATNSVGSTPPDAGPNQADSKKDKQSSKKRNRAHDPSGPASCDVCMRTVAYGGPVPEDGRTDLTFNLEVVCSLCTSRYARCSDCGGGGGVRLGVGKWRCKELFTPPRKTCNLSHARQVSVASMEYAVVRINAMSESDKPVIIEQCRQVFESALYSSLAVPEVLERGVANASTFADIKVRVDTGWAEARFFITDDVEYSEGFRRYLGLRWAAPKPRKSGQKRATETLDTSNVQADPSSIQRPGKNLSGYVTGEWDIYGGTLYISVSVPYSTGESYEGSAHLISMMTKRVHEDREEMIQGMLASGYGHNVHRVRPVQHCFTMLFFSPESKLVSFLESKRQLLPLERYLALYPDTDPTIFPPHRPVAENIRTQPGWNCLVRRLQPPTGPVPGQATRKGGSRVRN